MQDPAQPVETKWDDETRDAELARQAKAIAAYVERWTNVSEEQAEEQRETMEYLMRVLDEDRLSDRKLFSP